MSSRVHIEMRIEPYDPRQLDAVVRLSLRAWTPVFDSIQKAMDADVYREFYSEDWRVSQLHAVEEVCATADTKVWVAINSGSTMGFVATRVPSKQALHLTRAALLVSCGIKTMLPTA